MALNWLAGQIEDDTKGCVWTLWNPPPGPEGLEWYEIAGTTWSPVDAVTIKLDQVIVYDWTEVGDVPELTVCHGIYDNDTAIVPTASAGAPGFVAVSNRLTSPGFATIIGPQTLANIPLAQATSRLVVGASDAGVLVSGLMLVGTPTDVRIAEWPVSISHSRVSLSGSVEFEKTDEGYVLDAWAVEFEIAIAGNGESRLVRATNQSRLALHPTMSGWELEPFVLEYQDGSSSTWLISFDEMIFTE